MPVFAEVEARNVDEGDRVCVIGDAFLEMARPLLNITARAAEEIREEARALKAYWSPVASAKSMAPLIEFDAKMKTKGRNPGTTADFVVATLFVAGLIGQKPA